MAVFIDGKRAYNSLVIDNALILPQLVFAECKNKASIVTSSYTFTESGKFQFLVWERSSSAISPNTNVVIKLNNIEITPSFAQITGNTSIAWYYGEIEVEANDVFTVTTTLTESNRGIQTFILKNADVSKFAVIGFASNDNTTFAIGQKIHLQSYMGSFNSGATRMNYELGYNQPLSIPTPSGSSTYYYGATWAVQIA